MVATHAEISVSIKINSRSIYMKNHLTWERLDRIGWFSTVFLVIIVWTKFVWKKIFNLFIICGCQNRILFGCFGDIFILICIKEFTYLCIWVLLGSNNSMPVGWECLIFYRSKNILAKPYFSQKIFYPKCNFF